LCRRGSLSIAFKRSPTNLRVNSEPIAAFRDIAYSDKYRCTKSRVDRRAVKSIRRKQIT
jgi:hypothetical protein